MVERMAWKDGMKAVSKAEHSDVEWVEKWVALMAETMEPRTADWMALTMVDQMVVSSA